MSDVTRILSQIESGDPAAAGQLLPSVYKELRKLAAAKLARENSGQTLQVTALVHETPVAADLAKLRLFAGLSIEEAAIALDDSRATACRNWTYALIWLQAELSRQERPKKI